MVIFLPIAAESFPEPEIREHHYRGFRFESRRCRSASPRIAPVVLVAGIVQRKESWIRLEEHLLEAADVVSADLPGWGAADALPPEYGIDVLSGSLEHMLEDLGLGPVNLMAGSYGTAIAYRLAQDRPDLVSHMCLYSTAAAISDRSKQAFVEINEQVEQGRKGPAVELVADLMMSSSKLDDIIFGRAVRRMLMDRFATLDADEVAKAMDNTNRLLSRPPLDTSVGPSAPTLVAAGEYDTLTTPADCRELAATCPDSRFIVIRQADHLVYLERPAEIADLTIRFCAGDRIEDLDYTALVEDLRGDPVSATT